MTIAGFVDHLVDWLWGALVAVVAWAWTIDRRVAKLETKQDSVEKKVDDVNAKLDRLIDKLL